MPAAVAYLAAAFVLVVVALLLLASALLMALVPRWRPLAKRIVLGVPGSAVGLLAFQVAAFPILLAMLWTLVAPIAYFHGGGPTSPLFALLSVGALFAATLLFGAASLGGLVLGWRVANALGQCISLQDFLASDQVWNRASIIFKRPYRLPFLIWLLCAWSAMAMSAVQCWLNSGASIAEVPGTYRATAASPERYVLDIKADGSWEYRREGQLESVRAGRWEFEPSQSDTATAVITFKVKAGSRQGEPGSPPEHDPLARPGFVYSSVSRDCAGRLHVCFGADDQICFERQSEARQGGAAGTPGRSRTLAAGSPWRLTPPASCLL
jgi:hypothetical protein